jgi:hypothetical protein
VDDQPVTCKQFDHAVIVAVWHVGGKAVLSAKEAEALASALRRAARAARQFVVPVSDAQRERCRRAGVKGGAHRKRKP